MVIVVLAGFFVSLFIPPKNTVRYKMTVEVETPDGVVSGSAVREVTFEGQPKIPIVLPIGEDRGGHAILQGEAVFVDLGEGRSLFALLIGGIDDHEYSKRIPYRILRCRPPEWDNCNPSGEIWPTTENWRDDRTAFGLPRLVTFGNLTDPKSLTRVVPDDLVATFGEGFSLMSIRVEVTDEPLTRVLDGELVWLKEARSHTFARDGAFYKKFPPDVLHLGGR